MNQAELEDTILKLISIVRASERDLISMYLAKHGCSIPFGVRGRDKKKRKLRPAPVRDGLRKSIAKSKAEVRMAYLARRNEAGECITCGAPRDTTLYCRRCADKHAERNRRARAIQKAQA